MIYLKMLNNKETGWKPGQIMFTIAVLFGGITTAIVSMAYNHEIGQYMGKQITCVAGLKDYVGKIVYKKGNNIIISGVNNYYEYGPTDNCPVKKDMYGNCVWEVHKTGQFVSNIKTDDCYREGNYEDMIVNYNK